MKATRPPHKRENSGQVLVVTSLIVVMLLLSTVIYVRETGMDTPVYSGSSTLSFSVVKQASIHTVISALANVSNGGDTGILAANFGQLKSVMANHSYNAISNMNYTPLTDGVYQDGFWISWGASGEGTSSAYVSAALNFSGVSAAHYSEYTVNVTSKMVISGQYYELLTGFRKQVNVTCALYNEGKSALAQNFTVYYDYDGSLETEDWITVDAPTIVDYGHGVYFISFEAETKNRPNPMLISVHSQDTRGIRVLANATCTLL